MVFSKKWIQKLPQNFDPQRYEDEIALGTKWTLLNEKIKNGGMHEVETLLPGQIRVLKEIKTVWSPLVYVGFAISVFCFSYAGLSALSIKGLLIYGMMAFFWFAACSKFQSHYLIFDTQEKKLLESIEVPTRRDVRRTISEVLDISNIHALQLLEKGYRGSDGFSHTWVEINLVLTNHERFHVSDNDIKEVAKTHSARLAEELNIPVWDATR